MNALECLQRIESIEYAGETFPISEIRFDKFIDGTWGENLVQLRVNCGGTELRVRTLAEFPRDGKPSARASDVRSLFLRNLKRAIARELIAGRPSLARGNLQILADSL